MSTFLRSILPASQRRDLGDLAEKLDLGAGDRQAKSSAFWTMLTLSAIIAVAGLLTDSTATVIGAMIIAPLSVPIMGMAVGIVLAGTLVFSAYGYGAEARAGGFGGGAPTRWSASGSCWSSSRWSPTRWRTCSWRCGRSALPTPPRRGWRTCRAPA